ncbi:MAG: efflux RND transporter periplasmic adaptor subunit [Pseudomonadota bacterium]
MNRKQTIMIALMCAVAAILAALMLWRQPPAPSNGEHAAHQDSHGHDDRHPEPQAAEADEESGIAMSEAQIRGNGIAIDKAGPARIREHLHLPAQVRVDAERSVALAAPAQGIVESVPVSVGSSVKQGQPLVVVRSPAVAGWRADDASARARLALARTTHARERSLWEQGISARQDLDAAEAALREAGIAAAAARQRLAALGIKPDEEVSSAVTVRAPFDGVVIDKPAVAGQSVGETAALLTLADLSQVWIEAAVPGDSLAQVATGMPAEVVIAAQPGQFSGTVSFVGPVLGEATRMATARVTLPNPGLRLRPGMLATVDLLGQEASVPVAVASEAIQIVHERSVVFVRTASGFRAQEVTPGRSDGKRTEILKGLDAGTAYAGSGAFLLKAELGKGEAEHGH